MVFTNHSITNQFSKIKPLLLGMITIKMMTQMSIMIFNKIAQVLIMIHKIKMVRYIALLLLSMVHSLASASTRGQSMDGRMQFLVLMVTNRDKMKTLNLVNLLNS